MSRGPQVLDMEYREQDWPERGPGGPVFLLLRQICPVSSNNFHHHLLGLASEKTLAPWGNWSKVSWYVSCLVVITFLYMHQVPYISDNCLDLTLVHLTIVGGINRMPQQADIHGFWLATKGGFAEPSSAPTILSLYILSPIHTSHSPSPGIRMTFEGLHFVLWEEGAKGPGGKSSW